MNTMVHPNIRYEHTKARNCYRVFYRIDNTEVQIGTVRYTPEAPGIWTFRNLTESKEAETFGSTRLQAVKRYLDWFWKGEL